MIRWVASMFAFSCILVASNAEAQSATCPSDSAVCGEQLLRAAFRGETELVKKLLSDGASINYQDLKGRTAVHLATSENRLITLQLLIQSGASLDIKNKEGDAAIHLAAYGRPEITNALIHAGVKLNELGAVGETPLFISSSWSPETALILIQAGADVNARGKSGFTPLMEASAVCQLDLLKALLSRGADPGLFNYDHRHPPLTEAAQTGCLAGVRLLVEGGADVVVVSNNGTTPLLSAILADQTEISEYLIQFGGADSVGPLAAMCERGNIELLKLAVDQGVKLLEPKHRQQSLVRISVQKSRLNVLEFLFSLGADPNIEVSLHTPAIFEAIRQNSLPMVELLLASGAESNRVEATEKEMPLMKAASVLDWYGHLGTANPTIFRRLLEHSADVHAERDDGSNALDILLREGCGMSTPAECLEKVKLLLDYGSDPNHRNNDQWTPLHQIAFFGRGEAFANVTYLLLDRSADVDRIDGRGRTPLIMLAQRSKHETDAVVQVGALMLAKKPDLAVRHISLTALGWAKKEGHPKFVALLEAAGATE